ncbi:MAG TPA: radical SAM protein [Anaerolineales bacterium]|jgi:MoaA/NifB/PqqE/SkfB family radical SAM enzyme|nr:radical SAM protein [Anaerolineales bacterium]|tara:strand:+ start:7900 stop:8958 length:1059 start_codon:yes stop_codon:yes gene_type:complete
MNLLDKPRLVEKLKAFYDYTKANHGQIGTKQRGIDLNLNNACNLTCKYCFTNSPIGDHAKDTLDLDMVASIADQADELGIFEFDLQGGELLLRPELLFQAIEAIQPERFYLYLTTNGYFLDKVMAQRLADAKVGRVSVSVDSFDEKTHDAIRGRKESWRRAMAGLKNVQEVGMHPYLNITVGHYNAFSEDIELLCQYSEDHNYTTLLNVAVPSGMWLKIDKMIEIVVDEKDKARLMELRKKHRNILRNLWNPFDKHYESVLGCNTVNRMYITPLGDVLACPYVHIKIGNVYENTLEEIRDYGFSIKHFNQYSSLCLAGEDTEFIQKYMSFEGQSIFDPAIAQEIFNKDDFVN